jgi:hypothetical protein
MRRRGYPDVNHERPHRTFEPYLTFSLTTDRIFHGMSSSKSETRMGSP